MGNFLQILAKHWKTIAGAIVVGLVLISLTTIIVSDYKDRVNREFHKKCNEELAKELTAAFCEKIDEIISKLKTTNDKMAAVEEIRVLCDEYALPYATVLKPAYINN